jgi:signal transduction histidine kinase
MLHNLTRRLPPVRKSAAAIALLLSLTATAVGWQIAVRHVRSLSPQTLAADYLVPGLVLGYGLAASVLLFLVVRLWTTRHEAGHVVAKKLSASYRQSEDALRKTRDELQWNVQRRMDELSLTNQVLQEEIGRRIQAEILLENKINQLNQVNADLNDFAYIVSHDLRAPLRAIGSLAHWIYEDNNDVLNAEGRENLETLSGRVRRMDALINGILQYSRIGRIEPTREVLNSDKICREVIDSLAPPEGVAVRIAGTLPQFQYDRTHLEQVLQNLIGNSLKHLGKPAGEITVSAVESIGAWEFCVRDTGVGIEEKHFERIFKIFQTLKPRDQVEASGIGLTIVKAIVEKHGGKVRVESTPGQGTAFYFTVPKFPALSDDAPGYPAFAGAGDAVLVGAATETK